MNRKKEKAQAPKKGRAKWIVVGAIVVLVLAAAIGGNKEKGDSPVAEAITAPELTAEPVATPEPAVEATAEPEAQGYTLEHGELLSAIKNEIDGREVLVVKAKITPSYSNKVTVDQNYYNVVDLIQTQGADAFDELQYWAVADMTDGSEQKVVSFTVPASVIETIVAGSFPANTLGEYVDDLYVLPSLEE